MDHQLLKTASPESTGFAPDLLARVGDALRREVDEGRMPGAVVTIARRGAVVYNEALGYRDKAADAKMTMDAVFSIASMTKPMVTVAALMLLEEGRLMLGDPVSAYIPAFSDLTVLAPDAGDKLVTVPADREPTIQDLMRHTSGLSYKKRGMTAAHKRYPGDSITSVETHTAEEFITILAGTPLIFQPGTTWEYSLSTDVLGLVIEAIEGRTLGEVLRDRVWRPLGMTDTGFALNGEQRMRYAHALPVCPQTGETFNIHHAGDKSQKFESGGGGGISTAGDYIRFTQMLLGGGALHNRRILGRKTVELMTADHLKPGMGERIARTMDPAASGYGFGLGVAVRRQAGVAAFPGSKGDYYWSGVYGTYFWNDPVEQLSVVFMAMVPGPARVRYRQMIRALVYQALIQ